MKKLTLALVTLVTVNSNALADQCFDQVVKEYSDSSSMAPYSRVNEDYDVIQENEIKSYGRHIEFGPYQTQKLAYHAKGSFHSGWFHKVIIVSPETCEIEEIQTVADE
jgi:hypothetical protein